MEIRSLGHACFLLTSEAGTKLMMDPPAPETGYKVRAEIVDGVSASHAHYDHACFSLALGDPLRITECGEHVLKDMKITGFPTWHDEKQGALRGPNIMYLVEIDGIRLLHAGDLGAIPEKELLDSIGRVDVLLTPIGGTYTIDYLTAFEFCNLLKPKVVIPMHYKTPATDIDIGGVLPFLNAARGCYIHRMRQPDLVLNRENLGEDRIIVLEYQRNPEE